MTLRNVVGIALWLALPAHVALASSTNQPPVSTGLVVTTTPPAIKTIPHKAKATEACIDKIQTLIAKLTTLHASLTNQEVRLDCVERRLLKAKAVYELVRTIPAELTRLSDDEANDDLAEERFQRVTLALDRVENLTAEANDCLTLPLPPVKPLRIKRPVTPPELLPPTRPAGATNAAVIPIIQPPRSSGVRSANRAVRQGTLAFLLAQAMGVDDAGTAQSAIVALTKLGIEPPTGWQPEQAVNLADFSILITKALHLKLELTAPPLIHYQALREQGLPLDRFFPSYSGPAGSPWLLESEVMRFFATGLAEGSFRPGQVD